MDDQRRAPARALVPRTERQILARAVAAELSFVRAIITLALPIAVGSWNLRFGLLSRDSMHRLLLLASRSLVAKVRARTRKRLVLKLPSGTLTAPTAH